MAQVPVSPPAILTSWKEIASYLGKGVRTVQRWEAEFRLPVRRPDAHAKGIVYANTEELRQWLAEKWTPRTTGAEIIAAAPLESGLDLDREPTAVEQYWRSVIETHEAANRALQALNAKLQSDGDEMRASNKQLQSDYDDLRAADKKLQGDYDDMQAANKQLQSDYKGMRASKKQLQSDYNGMRASNKQLQNEYDDMQAAGKKLQKDYDEMQGRNARLLLQNRDLGNLLRSVDLPLVMVGSDLCVRRFTPLASKVLGLKEADIGRPVAELNLKIRSSELATRIAGTLTEGQPQQFRLRHGKEEFELIFTPFSTVDSHAEGVVLTLLRPPVPNKSTRKIVVRKK